MAGIGFELRQLGERDNLFAPIASLGHAAVIAAGPWLFTIIALALISLYTESLLGPNILASFRVLLIYAFSLSLVVTAPIVSVATRLVGDAIYLEKFERIRPVFVAALAMSGVTTAIMAASLYTLFFDLPIELVVAGGVCCVLVSEIWASLAFCGAVRDYKSITAGFLVGLSVAVVGTVLAANSGMGVCGMVWGANTGFAVIFFWLTSRVLATFPHPVPQLLPALINLTGAIGQYWKLALGALMSAIGIWIDKWIFWMSPVGQQVDIGLVHAPLYDSAMFIAYLAVIPSLSLFVSHLETSFFDKYRAYYNSIAGHATLRQIERQSRELERETMRTLTQVLLVQVTLCLIVALAAPLIVAATGLQYQQAGILRSGVLGALFQFMFLGCTSFLLFFDRHVEYLALQTLFFIMQVVLTLASLYLGPAYYGFGYLLSCFLCGVVSFVALDRTMRNLSFLTFVVSTSNRRATRPLQQESNRDNR